MKKKAPGIINARARFDYELGDDLVVGLELTGPEVKSARMQHVQLKGSYVAVKQDQLWLVNASFSVKTGEKGGGKTINTRDRRILAHRKQIDKFIVQKQQGLTIVPKRLITDGRFIKLVIAAGRGKKHYDKRQTIKKRDIERDNRRAGR
jgi:SsrA-binding protein